MQVEIDLKATFDTPLNIGSGMLAESVADKPLVRDAIGRPIIPGSSLKGKARHECERIIKALSPDKWVCEAPDPRRMCRGPDFCPICRIFGAPWRPSPLIFENLTLEIEGNAPPRNWERLHSIRETNLRTGVGINRERGVAEDEILYSAETYCQPPNLFYKGRIKGSLAERKEIALLLAGLRSIKALGSSCSRGLGWCNLEITVKLDDQPMSVEELLQEVGKW